MGLSEIGDRLVGGSILITAIIGLYLNVKLILKLKKRAKRNPDEKINKLYLVLAITHITLIFSVMPLSSSSSLVRKWLWGDIGCTYYGFMGVLLGNAMILMMLSICIDLFFETSLNDYGWETRDRTIITMLASSWILSLITAVIPLFGYPSYRKEPTGLSCTTVAVESEYVSYVNYIFSVFWFVYMMPLVGMAACYILIGSNIKVKNEKEIEAIKYNSKKIIILLILVLIEWGPYTLYYLWPCFDINVPLWLNAIAPPLCKLSTILTTLVLFDIVDNHEILKKDTDEDS